MEQNPIVIQILTMANIPAWDAAIKLETDDLVLTKAIDDAKFVMEPLLVRTFASLSNDILDSTSQRKHKGK